MFRNRMRSKIGSTKASVMKSDGVVRSHTRYQAVYGIGEPVARGLANFGVVPGIIGIGEGSEGPAKSAKSV